MSKRTALAALTALVSVCAHAGCLDRPGDADGRPIVAARVAGSSAADVDAPAGATLEARENHLFGCLLRTRGPSSAFSLGFDYQYTRYSYEGIPSRNRDLHRVQVPLAARWRLDRIDITAEVAPGLATSSNAIKDPFQRIGSDDVITTGRLTFAPAASRGVTWEIGIAHDRRFGEPALYPLAGIMVTGDRAVWRLVLPEPSVAVRLGPDSRLSASLYPAGSTWHVYTDDFEQRFRYRQRAVRAEVTLQQRLWRALNLELSVGWETDRRHRFADTSGAPVRLDVDDEAFLALGFSLGAPHLFRSHQTSNPAGLGFR